MGRGLWSTGLWTGRGPIDVMGWSRSLFHRLHRVVSVSAVAALFAGLLPAVAAPAAAPPPVSALAPLAAASVADVARYPAFAPTTVRVAGSNDLTYQLIAS